MWIQDRSSPTEHLGEDWAVAEVVAMGGLAVVVRSGYVNVADLGMAALPSDVWVAGERGFYS